MPRSLVSSQEPTNGPIEFLAFPLEIRLMVYEHLLHSEEDIPIRTECFKRSRQTRATACPTGIYKVCHLCKRTFKTASSYTSHRYIGCRAASSGNGDFLWQSPSKGPDLSPAILSTCRLIHSEASPLLYRSNKLRFEDPAGLNCWRWSMDTKQTVFLQRLHILLPLGYSTSRDVPLPSNQAGWWKYLTQSRFNLAQDFPQLKGVTVTLCRRLSLANAETMSLNLKMFRQCMYRLHWVQIIGLNDESLLSVLYPIVQRPEEKAGKRGVQTKIEEYDLFIGWKNATIWWGEPNSMAPCSIPAYTGDRRYRHRLFRIVDGNSVSYTSGKSFIASG